MDIEALKHAISIRDSGNKEGALEELRVLIEKTDDPTEKASLILNESNILTTLNRVPEARASLLQARHTAHDDCSKANADHQEGLIFLWESRYEDALRSFDLALTAYPSIHKDHENRFLIEAIQVDRGATLAILGRADVALPLLEAAINYEIADERKAWVFYNLGFCYQIMKQDQKAKSAFEHALKLSSDRNRILGSRYSLGVLYAKDGAWGKALLEFEWCEQHFVEGDIPRNYIYGCLVKVLRAIGRPAEADRYQKLVTG
jgi:tetratricopeptide (TPR) repeat protein